MSVTKVTSVHNIEKSKIRTYMIELYVVIHSRKKMKDGCTIFRLQ